MWRCILAVLAGMIAASIVIGVLETVGHTIIPPPPGMDATNPDSIKEAISKMRPAAFIAILVAWAAGSSVGGWVAAKIATRGKIICALAVGALIQLSGIASMLVIPHPLWFWIVSMLLPLPCSRLGAFLAKRAG